MKVINATFEKPWGGELTQFPDVIWRFSVTTDIEFPHGHKGFGGLLRKDPDGEGYGWQARHYGNTDWAPSALSRVDAIQNLLPLAFESIQQWKNAQGQEKIKRLARSQQATDLSTLLNANRTGYDIHVGVNDWKADEEPILFSIHISGLSEQQVREIAKDLESA